VTGAEPVKTVTKKQRKFRKDLQIRLLKREEEENKKNHRNKLRNEKKTRIKKEMENPPYSAAPLQVETGNEDNKNKYKSKGIGDLCERIRYKKSNIIYFNCACATLICLNQKKQKGSHNNPLKDLGRDQFSQLCFLHPIIQIVYRSLILLGTMLR
jgi:hypothetical protein